MSAIQMPEHSRTKLNQQAGLCFVVVRVVVTCHIQKSSFLFLVGVEDAAGPFDQSVVSGGVDEVHDLCYFLFFGLEGLPSAVLLGLQKLQLLGILLVDLLVRLLLHFAFALHLLVLRPQPPQFLLQPLPLSLKVVVLLGHLINVGFMTGRLYLLQADHLRTLELQLGVHEHEVYVHRGVRKRGLLDYSRHSVGSSHRKILKGHWHDASLFLDCSHNQVNFEVERRRLFPDEELGAGFQGELAVDERLPLAVSYKGGALANDDVQLHCLPNTDVHLIYFEQNPQHINMQSKSSRIFRHPSLSPNPFPPAFTKTILPSPTSHILYFSSPALLPSPFPGLYQINAIFQKRQR